METFFRLWQDKNTASAGTATSEVQYKEPQPPFFTGKAKEDIKAWLDLMATYLANTRRPAEQWPTLAASYLRDRAHTWWFYHKQAHPNMQLSWDDFRALLITRYAFAETPLLLRD